MNRLWICFLAAGFCSFSPDVEGQTPTPKSKTTVPTYAVPRPAPEFLWSGVNGKVRRLRDLRGHPVVLIFAENPGEKMFVKQIKELNRRSKQLATQYTLFFVAFTRETGLVTRTDIPFVILPDPGSVADAYRVGDFGIAVISPEGNVDYATDRVVTGQRVLDVIVNSYAAQVHARRQ
jgi:AhpC/TSA family